MYQCLVHLCHSTRLSLRNKSENLIFKNYSMTNGEIENSLGSDDFPFNLKQFTTDIYLKMKVK